MEDSRKSIPQPPYYDGFVRRNGNVLAIRRKIESAYKRIVFECISNTPLGDYPYLEKLDQVDELLFWKSYLDVAIPLPCGKKSAIRTKTQAIKCEVIVPGFVQISRDA